MPFHSSCVRLAEIKAKSASSFQNKKHKQNTPQANQQRHKNNPSKSNPFTKINSKSMRKRNHDSGAETLKVNFQSSTKNTKRKINEMEVMNLQKKQKSYFTNSNSPTQTEKPWSPNAEMKTLHTLYASVHPSLERFLQRELDSLVGSDKIQKVHDSQGGIELLVNSKELWTIAHMSRLAESLRVRIGLPFKARDWIDLEKGLAKVPFKSYLPWREKANGEMKDTEAVMPHIKVTCRKSRLYHDGAVKQRMLTFFTNTIFHGHRVFEPQKDDPTIFLRIENNIAQVSVDASGMSLYKRSAQEKHVTDAPLRPTLAAALLSAAEYTPGQSIWDPFCGAGTFVLEAFGMTGRGQATIDRHFAFQRWKMHSPRLYNDFVLQLPKHSMSEELSKLFVGSDVSQKAVQAARVNAKLYGFSPSPSFIHSDFQDIVPSIREDANRLIIANVPYGKRNITNRKKLESIFTRFGQMLLKRGDFQKVFVLSGNRDFERLSTTNGGSWCEVLQFSHGGWPVKLLKWIPAASSVPSTSSQTS